MKTKIIGIFTLAVFLTLFANTNAENFYKEKTVDIDISANMICNTSMPLMKKALIKVKGVESVEINQNDKKATVAFDDSITDVSKLEDALSMAGFKANDKEADQIGYQSLPRCCQQK